MQNERGKTFINYGTIDSERGTIIFPDNAITRTKLSLVEMAKAIPLTSMRVWDALSSLLPSAAANDDLGLITGTWATNSPVLQAGDLKTAGSTDRYAAFEVELEDNFTAGDDFTLRFYAGMADNAADTSATLDLVVYAPDGDAGLSSDLCSTAAQSINTTTMANYDFVVDTSGLTSGDSLLCRVHVNVNDAAGASAVTAQIGSIQKLREIRG
jgi:hypothetical protein